MKHLPEQTHYEVLDVSPKASAYEIGRAFREARTIYGEDALASYTFFSTGERAELLTRIEEAYEVLSDTGLRGGYDRSLGIDPQADSIPLQDRSEVSAGEDDVQSAASALRQKVRRGIINGEARRLLQRLDQAEVVTGQDLKRLRLAMGLKVEEIESGSNVGAGLIPALESDDLDDLPSWLTLRSSLKAYAELLQTDPEKIAGGFMKHLASRD